MSKKRFSDGFDSLFGDDFFKEEEQSKEQKTEAATAKPKAAARKKSGSSKKFAAGLESLLSEAFEEEVQDQLAGKKPEKPSAGQRKSFGGLDSLIRSTIDPQKIQASSSKNQRRLTIMIDADKVDQLKDIAKLEKTYLKYIIRDIVTAYLEKKTK